jgi:ketopantoate reductase
LRQAGSAPKVALKLDSGETEMAEKRVVVGAGAIGGYTGGNLAHNGFDVTIIDPWPEHVAAIRRDGLSLRASRPRNRSSRTRRCCT